MGKVVKWFFLLSKRLYKKPSFLAILVLIPVCVAAVSIAAGQDSGFVHIVLAQQQTGDGAGAKVIQSLLEEKGIILFSQANSPEAAVEMVQTGQVDEAWIFPVDVLEEIQTKREYIVQVVTREERIALKLAREKLSAALYEYGAKAYYLEYIRGELSQLEDLSDGELLAYFEQVKVDEDLFVYGNPANKQDGEDATNYLTSPIRGLLAILIVLCGMAATMYYMQDEKAGSFSCVRENRRGVVALGCVLTATVNISAVVLLALAVSSLAGSLLREIPVLFLYALSCGAFCLLLKEMFPGIRSYAVVMPLMTVILIGICPVFFDFRSLSALQLVFPPTYYVNALYDSRYLIYMAGYSVACLLLGWLLQIIKAVMKQK